MSPKPMDLLLIGPLRPVLAKGLADFTVHQLPPATDREAFWKSIADLRAMAVSAPVEPINAALYARLMGAIEDAPLRKRYRREIRRQFLVHRDPAHVLGYLIRCALHYHHYTLARQMARHHSPIVNSF